MYNKETASVHRMAEALVWANTFGLDRVRMSDGEFTVYTILDVKGIGPVYVGIYVREHHIMIAPADGSNGAKFGADSFYTGYLDSDYDDDDNDNGTPVWFDIIEFTKEKIKEYIVNNL
jgi:hypothetical protein